MHRSFSVLGVAISLSMIAACHRQRLAPALPPPIEDYCWWTYQVTSMPFAVVADRFAHGFTDAGFQRVEQFRTGDTAWTTTDPTPITTPSGRSRWSARVVAYAVGDSTRFRVFLGLGPRFNRWPSDADSVAAHSDRIPMCGRVLTAAGVPNTRPNRNPNVFDSLPVWRRGAAR
jgi:hypothetical protein